MFFKIRFENDRTDFLCVPDMGYNLGDESPLQAW